MMTLGEKWKHGFNRPQEEIYNLVGGFVMIDRLGIET